MKKNTRLIILSLIVFFSLLTIIKSYYYSDISGGTDLRNRVVGARLMGKGYSPYFYKWMPEDGERLLDPNDNRSRLVNGNTVTPAVLYVLFPITFLKYPDIRLIWTSLEILAAIAIIWIMLKTYEGTSPLTAAGIVILGLLTSNYWFMHVERGQMPIFYVFFFAIIYYVYKSDWKYAEFISGFMGGLFLFFRPFSAMIGLGFLLHGKVKWVKGYITGIIAGILILVIPNPPLWKDYFKAMAEFGNECLGKGHTIKETSVIKYPTVIEGATNLTRHERFNISSIPAMYAIIRKFGFVYTPVWSYLTCGIILCILSLSFYKRKVRTEPANLFLFAFLTYEVFELFILNWPAAYTLIEWTFPLFLIIQQSRYKSVFMILLFTGLLFLHNVPFDFHYQAFTGEIILLLGVAYFAFTESGKLNPGSE
jgi:hypothetical protein